MQPRLNEGDVVRCVVYIGATASEVIEGVLLSTPCATGDTWNIHGSNGKFYAVQQFLYMERP